ncbi:MAG: S24/S26 family peptidase [Candidatus Aenigmarchaeota archaeon]|nr:S24/S26 family peptidase [Candidatus Aenigmarchaeota archaeon]
MMRFRVEDESMLPAFHEGDYVLVRPGTPHEGDVVVLRWKGEHIIKRVYLADDGMYFVAGDNATASGRVGPVPREAIVGKVWLHAKK